MHNRFFTVWTLDKIVSPALTVPGILINTLGVIVLQKTYKPAGAYRVFLQVMLGADLFHLVVFYINWLLTTAMNSYTFPGWCHYLTLLASSTAFISRSSNLCLVMNRLCCLLGKKHIRRTGPLRSKKCGKVTYVVLLMVALVIYLNIAILIETVHIDSITICIPFLEYLNFVSVFQKAQVVIVDIVPAVINVGAFVYFGWCVYTHTYGGLSLTERGINTAVLPLLLLDLLLVLPSLTMKVVNVMLIPGILILMPPFYASDSLTFYLTFARLSIKPIVLAVCWASFRQTLLCVVRNRVDREDGGLGRVTSVSLDNLNRVSLA